MANDPLKMLGQTIQLLPKNKLYLFFNKVGYNIEALYALTHAPVKQYFFPEFEADIDLK
jgi:hypothetical protein